MQTARQGAAVGGGVRGQELLWQAEQVQLLLRLAADTGARRGELAALRLQDLDGRELGIGRAISAEQVSTTKTGRARRLTLGAGTARLCGRTPSTAGSISIRADSSDRGCSPRTPRRTSG